MEEIMKQDGQDSLTDGGPSRASTEDDFAGVRLGKWENTERQWENQEGGSWF